MIDLQGSKALPSLQEAQKVLSESAQKRLRLRKATREFEAVFISQILKNMRNVDFGDKEEGFGKDIMLDMADESVSRQLALTGMLGIGDLLYERLVQRLGGEGDDSAAQLNGVQRMSYRAQSRRTRLDLETFRSEIDRAARATGLSPALIESVIKQESAGDPTAVSPKGARGLMQLMPDTASEMGVTDTLDPGQNIMGGAKYLKNLLDRFGNLRLALAAYNAGPATVEKYGDVPPYAETEGYVDSIVTSLKELK